MLCDVNEAAQAAVIEAYKELTLGMRQCLVDHDLTRIILNDHYTFNYCFHSLRNDCVVLKHLLVS